MRTSFYVYTATFLGKGGEYSVTVLAKSMHLAVLRAIEEVQWDKLEMMREEKAPDWVPTPDEEKAAMEHASQTLLKIERGENVRKPR